MKKSIQKQMIETELSIWQTAYPRCKNILKKFADKIMLELRMR